jgi:hypothetical protein
MRKAWNGAMPVTLTLPVGLERRPRVRQRRLRRLTVGALIALAVALLAVGFWLPAKAELGEHLLNAAWQRTTVGDTTASPSLATLAIGDALTLERPDGSVSTYEVADLDVVDSERASLSLDADESIVVLVTRYPFDVATVGGSLRYVVTARQRF